MRKEDIIVLDVLKATLAIYNDEELLTALRKKSIYGICDMVVITKGHGKFELTSEEEDIVESYLKKYLPEHIWYKFCWDKLETQPRIEWLEKHIKLLEVTHE